MRFVFGPIPPSQTVDAAADGWVPMNVQSTIDRSRLWMFGIMAAILIMAFLFLQKAAYSPDLNPWMLVATVSAAALLVPLHEMMHCVGYLVPLNSQSLVTGICLNKGAWYVVYDAPLPRWRVMLMLVFPLLSLSVLPSLVVPLLAGSSLGFAMFLILAQASLCVGDVITLIRVWRQIPTGSLVHNSGWTTYWISPRLLKQKGNGDVFMPTNQ